MNAAADGHDGMARVDKDTPPGKVEGKVANHGQGKVPKVIGEEEKANGSQLTDRKGHRKAQP